MIHNVPLLELQASLLRDLEDALEQLMNKLRPDKEDTGMTDTILRLACCTSMTDYITT